MHPLIDLYRRHHEPMVRVRERFPKADLYGPLLCDPGVYLQQPVRLLVIGQETNGWACNPHDLQGQLRNYREFEVGRNWRSSPFWQLVRAVEKTLGLPACSCAWTNLNRYDEDHRPPKGAVLEAVTSLDFLVREEIALLRPDVCLFFTNRKHDARLEALYPGLKQEQVPRLPGPDFVRLCHADLPERTLRTPHPKSIRLRRLTDAFLNEISCMREAGHAHLDEN